MPEILIEDVLRSQPLAVSRLLTEVENHTAQGQQLLDALFPHTGNAQLVGITGAPGTGKSTLVNQLAAQVRRTNAEPTPRIAVLAVDPTSPFSGGAVLGDRVRMGELAGDPGVFIRSTASRGALGGLSPTAAGMVDVFDAAGFDLIIIETVGAGQAEVDIARLAHTTIVLDAPGLGDEIQTIKAGILEIADILVVNKADRPGADQTARRLRNMLELSPPNRRALGHHGPGLYPLGKEPGRGVSDREWKTPVLTTTATTGAGVPELLQKITDHRSYLQESGERQRRDRLRLQKELDILVQENLLQRWKRRVPESHYRQVIRDLGDRKISPRQALKKINPEETL